MSPFFEAGDIQIYHGDAREVLSSLGAEATACVTDPPYGLAFMGRDWDDFDPLEYQTWCRGWAEVVKGSMRPGAPLLAFSGTRTFHRAICGIEDAGFTVKDCLSWTYGSGFPKSYDLSKAVDQHKGKKDEREVVGEGKWANRGRSGNMPVPDKDPDNKRLGPSSETKITAPATDEAETWDGYGTALSPSWEPICYATKPREGTYAENALQHGVAGLNIDNARIEANDGGPDACDAPGWDSINEKNAEHGYRPDDYNQGGHSYEPHEQGRWPANVIFDEPAAADLDAEVGASSSNKRQPTGEGGSIYREDANAMRGSKTADTTERGFDDSGGPSRYFYTSKASKADRNAGLPPGEENDHPTVKPTDLMGWLLRLVEMPEENLILDPFCGSGTTLYVAQQMGLPAIGIDQNEESCELAAKRLSEPSLFSQD